MAIKSTDNDSSFKNANPTLTLELPKYFVVIYYPDMEKRSPGMPFGMKGDRQFWFTDSEVVPEASKLVRIELQAVTLKRGTNFIDGISWSKAKLSPNNIGIIKELKKHSAIVEYEPSPEVQAQETADFEDIDTVSEIVANCNDLHWLQVCLHSDKRMDVRKLIGERIRELEDIIASHRQKVAGSFG